MRRRVGMMVVGAVLAAIAVPLSAGTGSAAAGSDAPPGTRSAGTAAAAGNPWLDRRVLHAAHAGGDLEAPHSTLYAFKQALAAGADVLEMDVRLSADGVLVVHHDQTVDRITEATGRVADLTVARLQALDAAYWFVPGCWSCHDRPAAEYALRGIRTGARPAPAGYHRSDFRIPTLDEVLATFPDRVLDIEIKGESSADVATAEALADLLLARGRTDDVVVAAFSDELVAAFKARAPEIPTSPGLGELTAYFLGGVPLGDHAVLQLPPTYAGLEVLTADRVAQAHADGFAVWAWYDEAETDESYRRILDLGVDGIIASKPRLFESVLVSRDGPYRVPFAVAGDVLSCPAAHLSRCDGLAARVAPATATAPARVLGAAFVRARRGETVALPTALTGPGILAVLPGNLDTGLLVDPRPAG